MRTGTLSSRLLHFILPVSLAAVGAITLATYVVARRVILWESQQGIVAVTQSAAAEARAFFEQRHAELDLTAQSPLFKDHYSNVEYGLTAEAAVYRKEIERMLLDLALHAKAYPRLSYLDPRGREVVGVGEGAFDDVSFFKRITALKKGQRLVSPIERVTWQAAPVVRYGTPLRDDTGRLRGALIFTASLEPVYDSLAQRRLGLSGRSFLSARARVTEEDASGPTLTSLAPISGTPWSVVTVVDRGDFLNPLGLVSWVTLVLALVSSTILVLILTNQVRRHLRPIHDLSLAAELYARGQLDARVAPEGTSEVRALAAAFNAMADSLKARAQALIDSEARYRSAVENSPNAVIGLDQNFRITLWNRRAEAFFGWQPTEAYGRTLALVLGEPVYEKLKRQVETEGALRSVEVSGYSRDKRRLELNVSWTGHAASPASARDWFVEIQDETEKKKLQGQLVQAEKMTALGNLTAGIAHELNNPLAAVTGFAELLIAELQLSVSQKEDMQHLYQSAMRCRDIVQGLLLYTRKVPTAPRRLSLNFIAQSSISLFEYRFSRVEGIELEADLDPSRPEVAGEFQKLQQVLVNLVANSQDALRGRLGKRKITVRTRRTPEGAEVSVEDNGPGVPPEKRAQIFEPFYTTKAAGKGTGLGLPISLQIVSEFGGELKCEEAAGGGARFVARFPPCPADLPEPEPAMRLPAATKNAKVLIVDDEPQLVTLMTRLLSDDGLVSTAATSAPEALRLLEDEDFDLVLSDIELGAASGAELFEACKGKRRAPAFVFITGDILNRAVTERLLGCDVPVLTKPFLRTEFLRLVRRVLSDRNLKAS